MPRYLIRSVLLGSAGVAGYYYYQQQQQQQQQQDENNNIFSRLQQTMTEYKKKLDEILQQQQKQQSPTTATIRDGSQNETATTEQITHEQIVVPSLSEKFDESSPSENASREERPSDRARALLFDERGRIKRRLV